MQNYTSQTENPKLKIETMVQVWDTVKLDVDLPYYFKIDSYLYKVVTTEHLIRVDADKNWWGAKVYPTKHYHSEINKGTPITADEFDAAYSQAMMYVDLINRNEEPSKEVDDNVQIDELLENRAS